MGKPVIVATIDRQGRDQLRVSIAGERVELRVISPLAAGVMSPTKEGVTLPAAQIPALVAALQAAETKAGEG